MVFQNLLLVLTLIICAVVYDVRGQNDFDIIRQKHGIDYLQYVGLIPRHFKCNKWGYRRTYFNVFKLEIVCLEKPKLHAGSCPIWQVCQWSRFYNFFPATCRDDNDCDSACKCCYSPCYRTMTCRPAIISPTNIPKPTTSTTTTTEGNTKPPKTTHKVPQTTTPSSTTMTRDNDLAIELDYDNEVNLPGPNILQEESSEYDDEAGDSSVKVTKDYIPEIGAEIPEGKVTTPEPSLIRPKPDDESKESDNDVALGKEIDVGSGDDKVVFPNDFEGVETNAIPDMDNDDDEDNIVFERGSGYHDYID